MTQDAVDAGLGIPLIVTVGVFAIAILGIMVRAVWFWHRKRQARRCARARN
jgi:uncharacterized iron-regulated membrane protein